MAPANTANCLVRRLAALSLATSTVLLSCCHSAPPAESVGPSGPTEGERRMYRAGYRDGTDRGSAQAADELRGKDGEIASLRASLASAERERSEKVSALQSCEG